MVQRVAFHRSLLGRSILLGVLPAVAVVLAVVVLNGIRAWTDATEALERDLRNATDLVVRELDVRNQRNTELARLAACAQEAGQFGRRAETLRMLERLMRANPTVYGASIAYEPDADGNDAAGAVDGVPPEALGAGGRFYAYIKRDPKAPGGLRIETLQDTPEDEGLWYALPKRLYEQAGVREPVVTRPYNYLGTDIIEYVMPIVVDGRFRGIVGLDIALTDVQATLADVAKRLDADLFLETRGTFIAASTDDSAAAGGGAGNLRTAAVAASPLAPLFAEAAARRNDAWIAVDPLLGEECAYITEVVPTGSWRFVLRKPMRAVTSGLSTMLAANAVTAAVGLAVVVSLLVLGALAIVRRVRAARELAERIAAGDLRAEGATLRGGDETAELVRAMDRMNAQLAAIVGAVRGACAQLAATSTQLGASSREQSASVGAFGESTAQIASAIREISATGAELLRAVEAVDAGSRRTLESAEAGRTRLSAVTDTMERLDHRTREVADRLGAIAEKASAISSVVVTIAKVAEQTNLLSVNAAIEAEKAGDAGLGFLVVAREIRRLADQTAGASHDIARIVAQMQASVSEGVGEMERFTGDMRSGTGEVQALAEDLGGIITAVDRSFAGFAGVRDGMASQGAGVEQIELAAAQVAAGARQSASASQEFGRVAEELAHAVAVLQDAAARFRLRGDPDA
jgi:methyl-accepting chemotaxis protein WspA